MVNADLVSWVNLRRKASFSCFHKKQVFYDQGELRTENCTLLLSLIHTLVTVYCDHVSADRWSAAVVVQWFYAGATFCHSPS